MACAASETAARFGKVHELCNDSGVPVADTKSIAGLVGSHRNRPAHLAHAIRRNRRAVQEILARAIQRQHGRVSGKAGVIQRPACCSAGGRIRVCRPAVRRIGSSRHDRALY
jgi:hypothetical protein